MGLLGTSWDDPKTLATFQMAAGLLGGGNFGQAAARGLSAYSDTMSEATKAAAIKEERDYIKQQRESKAAQDQREEAERLRIQQVLRGALGGATPQQAMGMGGQLGPTQARADTIGRRQPLDANALIAQGVPFDQVEQLFKAQNLGRSKVARTIKGMGPDGREMEYQVDEFGQRVGDGMAQYRAPLSVNQGDRQTFVDPYSLKPQGSFGINETPDGRASRAVTMRGQNMTDARARERLAVDQAAGGAPPKPLPASALKMQQTALDAIGVSGGINADLQALEKQITDGSLSFGPLSNLLNAGRNAAGASSQQSRNFATFRSNMERLRNESLRLNTGVQTDGDAQRAWNELFQNINDTDLVKQRLQEIQRINQRGSELQKLKIDQVRANYGYEPLDVSQQMNQDAALNGGGQARGGASSGWEPSGKNSAMSGGGWSATLKK